MKILGLALYVLFTFGGYLRAQDRAQEQLRQAYGLEQRGQFGQAIDILRPVAGSPGMTVADAGSVWISLGYAYQEDSNLANAQRCYEQAAEIFRDQPTEKANYATALDSMANWYRTMGKLSTALKLDKNALARYEEAGDHAGAAWVAMHLAIIELMRERMDARQYLDEADREAQLAARRDDDFSAALYSTKGWLAELEGNVATAIFDYGQSLRLRRCQSCMLTGWEYVLLGKAYANDGRFADGLNNMRRGLAILSATTGQHSRRYLAAEIAYAQVLDSSGEHAESAALRSSAKRELRAGDAGKGARCCEDLMAKP